MNQKTETKPPMSNAFASMLASVRKGDLAADCSDELTELIRAVKETGRAGEIILKIKVKPVDSEGAQIQLTAQVNSKLPKKDKGSALFYTTADNLLVRDDPNQQELVLKTVPSETITEPLKKVTNGN